MFFNLKPGTQQSSIREISYKESMAQGHQQKYCLTCESSKDA